MQDNEYKFGYIGAFTIKATNETMAQRKLIDWLHKCPYGTLDMGRFIESEKTYEQFKMMDDEEDQLFKLMFSKGIGFNIRAPMKRQVCHQGYPFGKALLILLLIQ